MKKRIIIFAIVTVALVVYGIVMNISKQEADRELFESDGQTSMFQYHTPAIFNHPVVWW